MRGVVGEDEFLLDPWFFGILEEEGEKEARGVGNGEWIGERNLRGEKKTMLSTEWPFECQKITYK